MPKHVPAVAGHYYDEVGNSVFTIISAGVPKDKVIKVLAAYTVAPELLKAAKITLLGLKYEGINLEANFPELLAAIAKAEPMNA
jgi:hypothetical protein